MLRIIKSKPKHHASDVVRAFKQIESKHYEVKDIITTKTSSIFSSVMITEIRYFKKEK